MTTTAKGMLVSMRSPMAAYPVLLGIYDADEEEIVKAIFHIRTTKKTAILNLPPFGNEQGKFFQAELQRKFKLLKSCSLSPTPSISINVSSPFSVTVN